MKVKLLGRARRNLLEAARFYDGREENLGSYFLSSLLSEIYSLETYGGIHPIYLEKFHRSLSKRFPYAIYYKMEGVIISIYAILSTKIDPSKIKKLLR